MLFDDCGLLVDHRVCESTRTQAEVGVRCRANRSLLQVLFLLASRSDSAATVHRLVSGHLSLRRLQLLNLLSGDDSCLQVLLAGGMRAKNFLQGCSRLRAYLVVTVQLYSLCLRHLILLALKRAGQAVKHSIINRLSAFLLRPLGRRRVRGWLQRHLVAISLVEALCSVHGQLQATCTPAAQLGSVTCGRALHEPAASSDWRAAGLEDLARPRRLRL